MDTAGADAVSKSFNQNFINFAAKENKSQGDQLVLYHIKSAMAKQLLSPERGPGTSSRGNSVVLQRQ